MGRRFRQRVQESAWQRKMRKAVTGYMSQASQSIGALNQAMEVTHGILDALVKLSPAVGDMTMEDAIRKELERQAEEQRKEQEAKQEPEKTATEPVSGG